MHALRHQRLFSRHEVCTVNQLEAFVANLERSLERRYNACNDAGATPSSILLAVLNAVADAKEHLHDECCYESSKGD
jgi:hypothetical protein